MRRELRDFCWHRWCGRCYDRFIQACADILKNNDVARVAQLKAVSFNDLVFEGTVSAGALPSVFLLLRVASPSRR